MEEHDFWSLIEDCHRASEGDFREQVRLLGRRLSLLSPDQVLSFGNHWMKAEANAYRWPVVDGASLLLGSLSDDSFSDFTAWLISRGHEAYERVTTDPDSLVEFAHQREDADSPHAEELASTVYEAYERARLRQNAPGPTPGLAESEPAGARTDLADPDAVKARFPRLAAHRASAGDDEQEPGAASPAQSTVVGSETLACSSCGRPVDAQMVEEAYPNDRPPKVLQYRRCSGCHDLYWRHKGQRAWQPASEEEHPVVDLNIVFDSVESASRL